MMVISDKAGIRFQTPLKSSAFALITASTLTGEGIGWRDMVEVFFGKFPGYICLILTDESETSGRLRKILGDRYLDIDRITGQSLLLITTVPPPPDWFAKRIKEFMALPEWASRFYKRELYAVGTEEGQIVAKENTQALLREFFTNETSLPCLCFLQAVDTGAGDSTKTIEGYTFDFTAFENEASLMDAICYLAKQAEESRGKGLDVRQFANSCYSLRDPKSLQWRTVGHQSLKLADFLFAWVSKAREFVP